MREAFGAALNKGLGDSPERDEAPITKVGAMASAPRFGALCWRIKYANDARAFAPCVLLLAKKLPRQVGFGLRKRIADCALREWIVDGCRVCMGAGTTMFGAKKISCSACQGTGKHRHSDHERSAALNVADAGKFARLLGDAHRIIVGADGITGFIVRQQLERE